MCVWVCGCVGGYVCEGGGVCGWVVCAGVWVCTTSVGVYNYVQVCTTMCVGLPSSDRDGRMCACVRVCVTPGVRVTPIATQTDRQTERENERKRARERWRERDKEGERERHRARLP